MASVILQAFIREPTGGGRIRVCHRTQFVVSCDVAVAGVEL